MNECEHVYIRIMKHGGGPVYKCLICGDEQTEKPVAKEPKKKGGRKKNDDA